MTMPAAIVADETAPQHHREISGLDVQILDSLAAAESIWRALEARGAHTPYQRFDWISAYLQSGFTPSAELAIMVFFEGGQAIALIPFEIVKRFGVRMARIVGMPISNGDCLVFDPGRAEALDPDTLRRCLGQLPADIVNFHCVASRIGSHANPIAALGGDPAPDNFYVNDLVPGDAPYIEQSLPHKRRTNIRRSQRRLDENFGPVRLHRARTVEEVDTILDVFLDQRGRRFARMGIENIFASPAFRRFFRELAIESLDQREPAISVHALYAGEHIVATSIGTFGPAHYSQYINSTDYGEASRYTLMGVTLSLLVDDLRTQGITSFDMGLGDFDYKTDWTRRETVFDIVLPISAFGRVVAPLLRLARALKRRIKQTPALWRVARAAQSAITAMRRKS